MKVKVAYSVNIDDVPDKVAEIIKSIHDSVSDIDASIYDCSRIIKLETAIEKYVVALEMIHKMRLNLASMDQTLMDASTILEGYYNVKKKEQQPPEVPQPLPEKEALDEMKERIQAAQRDLPDAD